jgi:hypothetical protein
MENIKIVITRGSVAAGDDFGAPHKIEIEIPNTDSVEEIVSAVYKNYPLPKISGGRSAWSLMSNVPLAVIAQQWNSPKMIRVAPQIKISSLATQIDGVIRMHFNYHAQIDPEIVFKVLENLRFD